MIATTSLTKIPGSLQTDKILSLGLKACIGATQAVVSKFIVPGLAGKITWQKHAFTTVASLVMNCLIPAVVLIYLDVGCLGRWVSLWRPCRSSSQIFQRPFEHDDIYEPGGGLEEKTASFGMLLQQSDICNPHYPWSSTSMSSCIHVSLLRLQEIWLRKFVTTGLVMSGVTLMRDKLPTESGEVVGNFGIYMAYALVSSGHLPLMSVVLLLAFLGEGLVARVAWSKQHLKAQYAKNVAAPVVNLVALNRRFQGRFKH